LCLAGSEALLGKSRKGLVPGSGSIHGRGLGSESRAGCFNGEGLHPAAAVRVALRLAKTFNLAIEEVFTYTEDPKQEP
jgi:hypothetical protein